MHNAQCTMGNVQCAGATSVRFDRECIDGGQQTNLSTACALCIVHCAFRIYVETPKIRLAI
jgi:hypothetical protein